MASKTMFSVFLRNRRGKYAASIIFCFALTVGAYAQNPVSWSLSVTKPGKAGARLEAQLSASISGGWYLYSLTQPAGGPNATRITVASGSTFKLAGIIKAPPPKVKFDENFGINTESYAGTVTFIIPLQIAADAQIGRQTLVINARFQVCNETTCLPPRAVKVEAPVEIASASTAATITNANVSLAVKPSPTISLTPTPTSTSTPQTAATPEVNSTPGEQQFGNAGITGENKSDETGFLKNKSKSESNQPLILNRN